MSGLKKQFDKGVAYLKRNGMRKTCKRIVRKMILSQDVDYEKWLKEHMPSEDILDMQCKDNTGEKPVVLVKIQAETPELLEATRQSVDEQTYGFLAVGENIEYADFVLFLQNGVILPEHAVYELIKTAEQHPEAEVFYADDDILEGTAYKDPFFKPGYDACLFEQWDYLGDMLLVRRSLLQRAEDISDRKELLEKAAGVIREPQILAHTTGVYRLERKLVDRMLMEGPKISVIIPNKDHAQDLRTCVNSMVELGGYQNLEILIIENNSEEEETWHCYEELQQQYPFLKVHTWEEDFNYAAINNYAAQLAEGEYLLFLNNDTIVKSKGFLKELMKWGSARECGAIGAQLLYADETLQHGGVILGYGGIAGHAFESMAQERYEETIYAHVVRQMSAVTGACMLVKKQAFHQVGGFEEELKVAYNDIDLCMKLQKQGWQILYDPFAEMYHLESQTRGLEMSAQKAKRVSQEADFFCERWKEELEAGDLFYNPNLTLEKSDFSLKR